MHGGILLQKEFLINNEILHLIIDKLQYLAKEYVKCMTGKRWLKNQPSFFILLD